MVQCRCLFLVGMCLDSFVEAAQQEIEELHGVFMRHTPPQTPGKIGSCSAGKASICSGSLLGVKAGAVHGPRFLFVYQEEHEEEHGLCELHVILLDCQRPLLTSEAADAGG